mmetsp:Transcript_89095/g.255098  ORF Transcript_89095/g.255098 Transcript_89095/m.255098 type:complete len:346 (-) Transcript_89095:299-1336(-)
MAWCGALSFGAHHKQRPQLIDQRHHPEDADGATGKRAAPPAKDHEEHKSSRAERARLSASMQHRPHVVVVDGGVGRPQEEGRHEFDRSRQDQTQNAAGGDNLHTTIKQLRVDERCTTSRDRTVEKGEVPQGLGLRVVRVHEHVAQAVANVGAHHDLHQHEHRWPQRDGGRPQRRAIQEQKHHCEGRRPELDDASDRLGQMHFVGAVADQGPRQTEGIDRSKRGRQHDRVQRDAPRQLQHHGAALVPEVVAGGAFRPLTESMPNLEHDHGKRLDQGLEHQHVRREVHGHVVAVYRVDHRKADRQVVGGRGEEAEDRGGEDPPPERVLRTVGAQGHAEGQYVHGDFA